MHSAAANDSIVEALSVGTPVICTAVPVAEEQGLKNGVTGFILPFDMSEIPVKEIYKGVKKFKYTPRESHYEEVLSPGKVDIEELFPKDVTVRCIKAYNDLQIGRVIKPGEKYIVALDRGEHLADLKLVEIME